MKARNLNDFVMPILEGIKNTFCPSIYQNLAFDAPLGSNVDAMCGTSYDCSGGGGTCGTSYSCSGGGGVCSTSYSCSGS